MGVDAFAKTKKDKEPETKKFDGDCFWCGAHGHAMKDCRKKAAQNDQVTENSRTESQGQRQGRPRQEGKRRLSINGQMDRRNNVW